jgi:hypothetical protein
LVKDVKLVEVSAEIARNKLKGLMTEDEIAKLEQAGNATGKLGVKMMNCNESAEGMG